MTLQEIFITNLKYFRKMKKMTQNDLTLALDKGYNYINGIEQGKSFPQIDVIEQICKILEVKPSQMFDENSCKESVIRNNKDELANEISGKIYELLREDIKREVMAVLQSF